jgi:hypothetical protein
LTKHDIGSSDHSCGVGSHGYGLTNHDHGLQNHDIGLRRHGPVFEEKVMACRNSAAVWKAMTRISRQQSCFAKLLAEQGPFLANHDPGLMRRVMAFKTIVGFSATEAWPHRPCRCFPNSQPSVIETGSLFCYG